MRSFILFSSVGTVGFLVDAGILFVLIPYFGPYIARLFSFLVAVFVTWLLNRNFTFNSQNHGLSEFKRYFASQSFGAGLNYFVYAIAIYSSEWMTRFPLAALGLGSIAGLTVNFVLAKKYVFKEIVKEDCKMISRVARNIRFGYLMPVALILALITGGVISLLFGQDANWDIKNYHIHNAWALLNNRMGIDIFTAGIQSYFNPLLDLPYYMVAIEWFSSSPRLVAFFMGLPAGILLFFVWLCVSEVIRAFKVERHFTFIMTGIVVAMGMSGAATISQWGTTFNEIQVATLVVAGVYVIIAKIDLAKSNLKWFVIAGICLGIAAGLKLTAAIYAPGAFLAIGIMSRSLKFGVPRAVWFSVGWLSGFLVFYGWWGYRLYKLTGSPMFPMFNALFKSPLISSGSGMDNRFKPTGFIETLFYPFHWISPNSMVVVEPTFADPRFAAAYLAFLMMGLAYIYYRIGKGSSLINGFSGVVIPRQASTLMIWFVVSYLLWQFMFSILRYAVPIEAFTGLVILIGLLVIARLLNFSKNSLLTLISLSIIGLLCGTYTQYPEWGRVSYGKKVVEVENVALPNNSLVIFNGPPVAYLAPFLIKDNKGVSFIGIVNDLSGQRDYPLWTNVSERIREQTGKIYMVERPEQRHMRSYISEFGLSINHESCREYKSSIDQPFTVCELQKVSK